MDASKKHNERISNQNLLKPAQNQEKKTNQARFYEKNIFGESCARLYEKER